VHRHHLTKTGAVEPKGDAISGRIPLYFNNDVIFGIVRPAEAMPVNQFYRNGVADEMLFIHEGSGLCDTVFGPLRYGPGDYLVLPIGTTWRLDPDEGSEQRMLYLEAPSEIEPPKRYRNDYGQLLEHSPYSQRDIHQPDEAAPRSDAGDFVIHVRSTDLVTAYHFKHHPFDLIGWDGYLWPFRFNIADFQPITGRVHQPPPVHQVFEANNFVVCNFVPRKVDYHPLSIPVPYYHSNVDSDEVMFYCGGDYEARKGSGIGLGSVSLHPGGHSHGPQPGAAEASIGKHYFDELAVMVDTFRPLEIGEGGRACDDGAYALSWNRALRG
jgi:homogentisate 1,2-dioxygenase